MRQPNSVATPVSRRSAKKATGKTKQRAMLLPDARTANASRKKSPSVSEHRRSVVHRGFRRIAMMENGRISMPAPMAGAALRLTAIVTPVICLNAPPKDAVPPTV